MPDFTSTETIMILITLAFFIIVFFGIFLKAFIKLGIAIALIVVCFGFGFNWLPEQFEKLKNGETTVNKIIDDVSDQSEVILNQTANAIDVGKDYIEENGKGWFDSWLSGMEKLKDWLWEDAEGTEDGETTVEPQPEPTAEKE